MIQQCFGSREGSLTKANSDCFEPSLSRINTVVQAVISNKVDVVQLRRLRIDQTTTVQSPAADSDSVESCIRLYVKYVKLHPFILSKNNSRTSLVADVRILLLFFIYEAA